MTMADDMSHLSVTSYNIHHGEGMDRVLDIDRIAGVISSTAPDLVALQEIDRGCTRSGNRDTLAELSEALGMAYCFGKTIDLQGGEYGIGVLSRFPIMSSRTHLLPSEDEQRCVLETTVDTGDITGLLCFASVHMDFPSEEVRIRQISALLEVFRDRSGPIILAGDFNDERSHTSVKMMAEAGWEILDRDGQKTFPSPEPEIEIDFVMLRNLGHIAAQSCVVDERVASDHCPVHSMIHVSTS